MTEALDEYLAQPFYVAEPFTGRTGEHVAPDELHDHVTELLATTHSVASPLPPHPARSPNRGRTPRQMIAPACLSASMRSHSQPSSSSMSSVSWPSSGVARSVNRE